MWFRKLYGGGRGLKLTVQDKAGLSHMTLNEVSAEKCSDSRGCFPSRIYTNWDCESVWQPTSVLDLCDRATFWL